MQLEQTSLKNIKPNCAFSCHAGGDVRIRQTLLNASTDPRIKDIRITSTNAEYGLKKGSHKLTDILSDLSSNVIPMQPKEHGGTVLGDKHCSSLEVLDNAAAILHQMAGTPWLALEKLTIDSVEAGALENGEYDAQFFLKQLALMADSAFKERLHNKNISFSHALCSQAYPKLAVSKVMKAL